MNLRTGMKTDSDSDYSKRKMIVCRVFYMEQLIIMDTGLRGMKNSRLGYSRRKGALRYEKSQLQIHSTNNIKITSWTCTTFESSCDGCSLFVGEAIGETKESVHGSFAIFLGQLDHLTQEMISFELGKR
jgi:hypothetical protein